MNYIQKMRPALVFRGNFRLKILAASSLVPPYLYWSENGEATREARGAQQVPRIFSDKISVPPEHAVQSVKQETPFCVKIGHALI